MSETVVSGGSASYFLGVPPRKKGRRRGKEKRGEELGFLPYQGESTSGRILWSSRFLVATELLQLL